MSERLDGAGLVLGLMGKPDRAWVGALVGVWMHGWVHGWW